MIVPLQSTCVNAIRIFLLDKVSHINIEVAITMDFSCTSATSADLRVCLSDSYKPMQPDIVKDERVGGHCYFTLTFIKKKSGLHRTSCHSL